MQITVGSSVPQTSGLVEVSNFILCWHEPGGICEIISVQVSSAFCGNSPAC